MLLLRNKNNYLPILEIILNPHLVPHYHTELTGFPDEGSIKSAQNPAACKASQTAVAPSTN